MYDHAGTTPRDQLLALFKTPADAILDDAAFDRYARSVFEYQYTHNAPYRAYCDRRRVTPDGLTHWTSVPPVPTAAFKEVALTTGDARAAQAVFRTSGTTEGAERRGTHYVLDLSLYNASLLPGFAAALLPDAVTMPMLSIIPPASEIPDSSLAHMVTTVMAELGEDGSRNFASAERGIDTDAFEQALREHTEQDRAVCILGTSFSFVHWLDDIAARGIRFRLPVGSRLMDTGGYKGRSREVPAETLLTSYEQLIGIPPHASVNEYGMTELCSQMYDVSLREYFANGDAGPRRKRPPPWMRVRIVDPVTLEAVPDGDAGLVQLFDLANLESVMAVQTEDLGVAVGDGYALLGRSPGAQPRGCSIAMDDLLHAVRAR